MCCSQRSVHWVRMARLARAPLMNWKMHRLSSLYGPLQWPTLWWSSMCWDPTRYDCHPQEMLASRCWTDMSYSCRTIAHVRLSSISQLTTLKLSVVFSLALAQCKSSPCALSGPAIRCKVPTAFHRDRCLNTAPACIPSSGSFHS